MIAKTYTCDDCPAQAKFTGYKKARAAGWAVAKDYSKCYCPTCAKDHRKGKAAEKNVEIDLPLLDGIEQLKIKNVG